MSVIAMIKIFIFRKLVKIIHFLKITHAKFYEKNVATNEKVYYFIGF